MSRKSVAREETVKLGNELVKMVWRSRRVCKSQMRTMVRDGHEMISLSWIGTDSQGRVTGERRFVVDIDYTTQKVRTHENGAVRDCPTMAIPARLMAALDAGD